MFSTFFYGCMIIFSTVTPTISNFLQRIESDQGLKRAGELIGVKCLKDSDKF